MKSNESRLLEDIRHELGHVSSELGVAFELLCRSPENTEDAKEIHIHGMSRIATVLAAIDRATLVSDRSSEHEKL